ncbi:RNA polymerase factor sigma-54 [Lysobacter sp. LF1]|uniref:RNA polymerase sigma-54 factor n=1 Tax=Lysobacter stagni TaxID=3045172 RepID=A0ABT6XLC4_9GAMM|nr:RNA polymerase factor sigma-54 [Lysobacter sp. LF1]MDI9240560.1 RNA polymerase factor sigma-54 [Lysobacter sp. LF1]
MKATMSPKLGLGVNLTPQLLQSIRMLQLTAPQLEMELRQALERNPLLEQEEPEDDIDDACADAQLETAAWDELPEPSFLSGGSVGSDYDDAASRVAESASTDPRVRLLQSLALQWDARDLSIAAWWLDQCDDRGYLEAPLDELHLLGHGACNVDASELEIVRQRLLHGEWPGVAAVDAGECLRAQLSMQPESGARTLAMRILRDHVDLLAMHDEAALAKALRVDADAVRAAVALILTLRAHPIEDAPAREHDVIVPDVVAWRADGAWRVALNARSTPRVRIAAHCERALADAPGDVSALRGMLDEARWLVRGVTMRNDTLLRTARVLVERQRAYLEQGDEAIAPLTLREVADAIGMHESTVSRITSGKYLQTPRGTIELKRLFAVRLEGADVSGSAVKAMVKRLIDDEPAHAPLADDTIAGLLARQGVRVARRTVAKYRDQLAIAPARQRRRTPAVLAKAG